MKSEIKKCKSLEDFECLIDDVYNSVQDIYLNKIKIRKVKKYGGFDDIFDNGHSIDYYFEDNNLFLDICIEIHR